MTPEHVARSAHEAAAESPGRSAASPTTLAAEPPGPAIIAVGWLVALWCVGFAVVNVAYEATGRFADGDFAEYATVLSVMSWVVVVLKLVGAAAALMAVRPLPRAGSPRLVGLVLWGAAALLVLYSAGNLVQGAGMLVGVRGDRDDLTWMVGAYAGFFLLGAVGYSMLAGSFARRYGTSLRTKVLGVVGAPVFLAVLLLVIPWLLIWLGL